MTVRYLSKEWAERVAEALNGDAEFRLASAGQDAVIQTTVTDAPAGEITYYVEFDDGAVRIEFGPAERPDVELSVTYGTACAIAQGELSGEAAFATGRLKSVGNVGRLMTLAGPMSYLPSAERASGVEY